MKPVPKYLKDSYSLDIHSYKDVPGWINDAEYIYEHAVNKGSDGQIFVEIGTLLGQSTLRMATLIDESNKKIKFDAIDIFYSIPNVVKHSHPVEFTQYLQLFDDFNLDILGIIKHPLRQLNVEDLVNLIVCDEKYAFKLYDDESISFLWIDGEHTYDVVYSHLVNFWSKIKPGGILAGDDIHYEEVYEAVMDFEKEYKIRGKNSKQPDYLSNCYNSFYFEKS